MAFELTLYHSAENLAAQSTTLHFETRPAPEEIRSKLSEEGTLTPAQLDFCVDLVTRTDSLDKITIPHEALYSPSLVSLQPPDSQHGVSTSARRSRASVSPQVPKPENASLSKANELLTNLAGAASESESVPAQGNPSPIQNDVSGAGDSAQNLNPIVSPDIESGERGGGDADLVKGGEATALSATESAGSSAPARKVPGIYKTVRKTEKKGSGAACTVKGKVPEFLLGFTSGIGSATLGLVFNVEFELKPHASGGTELHIVPTLGPHHKKALCLLPIGILAKLGKILISAGKSLSKVFTKKGRANLNVTIKEFVKSAMLPKALLKLAAISTGVLVGGLVATAIFGNPVGMTAFLAGVMTVGCVAFGTGLFARAAQHKVLGEGEGEGALGKIRRGFYNDLTSPRAAATAGEFFGTVAGVALVAGAMEVGAHSLASHGGEHGAGGSHGADAGHGADVGHGAAVEHGADALHGSGGDHGTSLAGGQGVEHGAAPAGTPSADPASGGHSPAANAVERVHQAEYIQEVAESLVVAEELDEAVHDLDELGSQDHLKTIEEEE